MAAGDLTTVEKVRAYLKLEDVRDDDFLAQLVRASSAWVRGELSLAVEEADYDQTFDGDGGQALSLPETPVISVSSVTVDGEPIPERLDSTGSGWVQDVSQVRLSGYYFTKGAQNVEIAWRAGYATPIPADLELAVIMHASLMYRDRDRSGVATVSISGESVSYGGITKSEIEGILDRYRRVVFA